MKIHHAVVAIIVALICALTIATPLTLLSQTISPTSTTMEPQQVASFTDVWIKSIDEETIDWNDSLEGQTATKPLFIYETPCVMTFKAPVDALPGDSANINFTWCEEDDKSCEASTTVRVANVTLTGPAADTTVNFEIPHLSWSKYMSSHIKFSLVQNRGETQTFISMYNSQYIYESDFASKGAKTAIIIVVVFCCVCIVMALAVLGFFIAKKVKKMRRQRHFPTQAGGHNLWRRS